MAAPSPARPIVQAKKAFFSDKVFYVNSSPMCLMFARRAIMIEAPMTIIQIHVKTILTSSSPMKESMRVAAMPSVKQASHETLTVLPRFSSMLGQIIQPKAFPITRYVRRIFESCDVKRNVFVRFSGWSSAKKNATIVSINSKDMKKVRGRIA